MSQMRAQHPPAWRFMSGRYAQSQYLALHLAIGFAVSLAVIGDLRVDHRRPRSTARRSRASTSSSPRGCASRSRPRRCSVFEFLSSLGGRGAMTLLFFAGGFVYAFGGRASSWWGGARRSSAARCSTRRCASWCGGRSCRSPMSCCSTGAPGWRAGTRWACSSASGCSPISSASFLARACVAQPDHRPRRRDRRRDHDQPLYLGQHYLSDADRRSRRGAALADDLRVRHGDRAQRHWDR